MMGDGWSGAELDRLGRAVLEAAADAIILADREGVIRFWNAGAERLFGFSAAEALGRPLDIIVPEPQRTRHWAGFSRVMETGKSRYGAGEVLAVPGLRKDGGRISLEFTIVPLHDPAGRMEGWARQRYSRGACAFDRSGHSRYPHSSRLPCRPGPP
jgi:PAS domain S-box-containing protein